MFGNDLGCKALRSHAIHRCASSEEDWLLLKRASEDEERG